MYRGLAKLVGMEVMHTGNTLESEIETLSENFADYDYFFIHVILTAPVRTATLTGRSKS